MTAKQAWALILSLLIATTVLANAGPPPLPKGKKIIEPPVRFEGVDKHPDHVFYLHYGAVYFGSFLVEVKESEPIKISFNHRNRVPSADLLLLAIERTDFEKRKKEDPSLKWLKSDPRGALTAPLPRVETVAPENVKEVPTTTFRVAIREGKLSAEKVEPKKSAAAAPAGFVPPWTFGLVGSLSLAWLGVWFARRESRPS